MKEDKGIFVAIDEDENEDEQNAVESVTFALEDGTETASLSDLLKTGFFDYSTLRPLKSERRLINKARRLARIARREARDRRQAAQPKQMELAI